MDSEDYIQTMIEDFAQSVKEQYEKEMNEQKQKYENELKQYENFFSQQNKQFEQLLQIASQSGSQTCDKEITEEKPRKLKYGQGSISKRERKNRKGSTYVWYQIRWFDARGKLHTKTASTLEDANKALARLKRDNKPNTLKTFGEHIHEWYDVFVRPDCGEKRNKSNLFQISRIPLIIMGKPLVQVTALELQQFLQTIPYPSPKMQTKQLIKAALVYAFNNALIKHNIGGLLKAELPRTQEKQILSRDIEDKFFSLLPEKYRGHAIGLLYTGCRIGEFLRLNENWQTDIDYKNKKIKIRETKSLRQKDIKRGTTFKFREMPLLPKVAELKFPLPKIKQKTINPVFNMASKRLGIKITPHSMRHTFATRCRDAGIDLKTYSEWLGHTKVGITVDLYAAHTTTERSQKEAEKLYSKV